MNSQANTPVTTSVITTAYPFSPASSNPTDDFYKGLKNYTLKDIEILQGISNSTVGEYGKCSTALAGLCFTAIEQIGMLLRSDLEIKIDQYMLGRKRDEKIKKFVKHFEDKLVEFSISSVLLNKVFGEFRNKIAHNILPGHELSISNKIEDNTQKLLVSVNGRCCLNVDCLSNYVREALESLIAERPSTIQSNLAILNTYYVNNPPYLNC